MNVIKFPSFSRTFPMSHKSHDIMPKTAASQLPTQRSWPPNASHILNAHCARSHMRKNGLSSSGQPMHLSTLRAVVPTGPQFRRYPTNLGKRKNPHTEMPVVLQHLPPDLQDTSGISLLRLSYCWQPLEHERSFAQSSAKSSTIRFMSLPLASMATSVEEEWNGHRFIRDQEKQGVPSASCCSMA